MLVLQGERSDTVSNRLDALQDEVRTMREARPDRLDRLIALTTRERTLSVARLAAIEDRLARVEERLGL